VKTGNTGLGHVFSNITVVSEILVRPREGIRELETPAVIDAINTGGKHRSTCPRQPQ